MEITTQDSLAESALASARDYAGTYGNVERIAGKMTEIGGKPISRQMVGRWLQNRSGLGFGNALVLLIAVAVLKKGVMPKTLIIKINSKN